MTVVVYIVSRFDETERAYVSTTAPTLERLNALKVAGYQVHSAGVSVPGASDLVDKLPPVVGVPELT